MTFSVYYKGVDDGEDNQQMPIKFNEQTFFWPVSCLMPDRQFYKTAISVDDNIVQK